MLSYLRDALLVLQESERDHTERPIGSHHSNSWETYYARTRAHLSTDKPKDEAVHSDSETADADLEAEAEEGAEADLNEEDDPGTSWFSEHNAPQKVLRFLTRKSFPLSPKNTLRRGRDAQPRILDLGTGNGSMLALLRKRGGFAGDMVGVDYSAQSVELARELQRTRGHSAYWSDDEDEEEEEESDEGEDGEDVEGEGGDLNAAIQAAKETPIRFEEWDILNSTALLSPSGTPISPPPTAKTLPWFPYSAGGFDIVLDKGTFDAISLAEDAKATRVCERYPDIARRLLRKDGVLVVTSCNWTEEELVRWFVGAGEAEDRDRLVVWGRAEYPRFRFGGHEGQGVCTVCFQRVVDN